MIKKLIGKVFTPEVIRFIIVGVVSALIEYGLYFLFKEGFDYLIANVLAFGCTNIVTFILSRRYVFNSANENKAQEATLFTLCLFGALLVNQFVLWALVEFIVIDDRIAKAIAISVTVIWNFFTRKHLVFKNRAVAAQRSTTKDF